jgi:ribosomal protein L40E
MEKPTAVVAEMYELFGVQICPKCGDRGSNTFDAEDCKEKHDEESSSVIEHSTSDGSESGRRGSESKYLRRKMFDA